MIKGEKPPFQILRFMIAALFGGASILATRWLFTSGTIPLIDVNPNTWVTEIFNFASFIVFVVSCVSGILWYIIATGKSVKFDPIKDTQSIRAIWAGILLPPVASIIFVIWKFGEASPGALPWFLAALVVNLVFTFWLATVVSTPNIMYNVVPFAPFIRNILRID